MKKALLMSVFISLLGATSAHAFDWFGGRLSIGGGVGRAKPKLPYAYQDAYQDGEMWTAHMKYYINNDVSVIASYADLEPYARGNKGDQYRFRPIVGSVRYNFFHHLPFTPYLTAGAGYSTNKHEISGSSTDKWDGFTYQGGLGLEFFITEGTSLGAEALYHHFEAPSGINSVYAPYRLISAVGTVNFYFGPGPSAKRAQEALEAEKAAAAKAQADADAAKAQALAAQQAAAQAQQGLNSAQQQAADAAAKAQQEAAAAQAEVDQLKQMMSNKTISPIAFKTGSADLLVASNATLDKVAEIAKKYPDLKLRVEGHTDSVGSDASNQTLSQKRADSVRNYLTSTAGLPGDQIVAVGFGETRPIASNDTAEGRAQNRRVEFIFFLK